jgi:hypothetical protein
MSRRAPRPLSHALSHLERDLGPATLLAEVQRLWSDTAGPAIAAEAEPRKESAGVLTIACASAVWAQELELMGPALVERLNGALGRPALTRLRCVVAPRADPV